MVAERRRRPRPDRGDPAPAERTGVEAVRGEPAGEEAVHPVHRREHDPRVATRIRPRDGQRLDGDRRQLDDRRPELLEAVPERARLLSCPRDHDGAAEQRAGLEPAEVQAGHGTDHDRARRGDTERGDGGERGPGRRLLGRVPQRTAATGVSGSRPCSMSRSTIVSRRPAPIRITSVPPARGERGPVGVGRALRRVLVAGDDGDVRRQPAVGHRDPGVGGRGNRGR